jgi:hypothetical protein
MVAQSSYDRELSPRLGIRGNGRGIWEQSSRYLVWAGALCATQSDIARVTKGKGMIKPRAWLVKAELAVAIAAGLLGLLTVFWHDWIEALTGWDPDHHSGSLEWLIVAALLAISLAVGLRARRDLAALREAAVHSRSGSQ